MAFGAKNIHKILWQKMNNQQWFILLENENKHILSILNNGDDLRGKATKYLWQGSKIAGIDQIIWYEGRKLPNLLYKILFLNLSNKQWKLNSLQITADQAVEEVAVADIPHTDKNTKLGLINDNNDELILLNVTIPNNTSTTLRTVAKTGRLIERSVKNIFILQF